MYVDKMLDRARAVQTLSRLNRIHPEEDDTFVLDFRNEAEDIAGGVRAVLRAHGRAADRPEPPLGHPPRLGRLRRAAPRGDRGGGAGAARAGADDEAARRSLRRARPGARPVRASSTRRSDGVPDALDTFVRTYSFVAQIVAFTDPQLERDYLYCRALLAYAPRRRHARAARPGHRGRAHPPAAPDDLRAARLSLEAGGGEVRRDLRRAKGQQHEPEQEHLSQIVEVSTSASGST